MYLLHNLKKSPSKDLRIASNYNELVDIKKYTNIDDVLTFDGVYDSVYHNRDKLKNRKVILFYCGKYTGKTNTFDTGMPLELFCNLDQLYEMVNDYGFELGYHSYSHPDLTTLSDEELEFEVKKPDESIQFFAYPYGRFDKRVEEAVKKAGYLRAFSVNQGDNSNYQLLRRYL